MKRKIAKKVSSTDGEDDSLDQESEKEETQKRQGRSSRSKKSSPKKGKYTDPETDSENENEADNEVSKENGHNEAHKLKKTKSKKGSKDDDKKSKPQSESSSDEKDPLGEETEEDETQYEVEKIIDDKMVKGAKHYLIRWRGYTEESDTWEPANTLDCDDLIKEYNKEKGKTKLPEKEKNKSVGKEKNIIKEEDWKPNWDENEDFEVSRILDVYFHKNGKKDFLVHWKGYPTSENSWEPEENLDCKDLIRKYMEKVKVAQQYEEKELRVNRKPVQRLAFSMHEHSRRLSRRINQKERVRYYEIE